MDTDVYAIGNRFNYVEGNGANGQVLTYEQSVSHRKYDRNVSSYVYGMQYQTVYGHVYDNGNYSASDDAMMSASGKSKVRFRAEDYIAIERLWINVGADGVIVSIGRRTKRDGGYRRERGDALRNY